MNSITFEIDIQIFDQLLLTVSTKLVNGLTLEETFVSSYDKEHILENIRDNRDFRFFNEDRSKKYLVNLREAGLEEKILKDLEND